MIEKEKKEWNSLAESNQKIIATWVHDLESGNYIQVQGKYVGENPKEFCALGLLKKQHLTHTETYRLLGSLRGDILYMNDFLDRDFKEIAKVVRKELKIPDEV